MMMISTMYRMTALIQSATKIVEVMNIGRGCAASRRPGGYAGRLRINFGFPISTCRKAAWQGNTLNNAHLIHQLYAIIRLYCVTDVGKY
jgi:hypothetical protein